MWSKTDIVTMKMAWLTTAQMLEAIALVMALKLSLAHEREITCNATLVPLTCNVPELSTVALRAPEGAVAAAWFKRSDSSRPLCVGSERCVLYAATRGDAGLYYGAAPGSSRSTSANKYFVRVNVLIPPVLQNVVECDDSGTQCWTPALAVYWDDAQFTISVAYLGSGEVTWTKTISDGSPSPFTCSPTHCTQSSSTYQMVHYVNITLRNPYDNSEHVIYTANVTNSAGFNTSSTEVDLQCHSNPAPAPSATSIELKIGTVGNVTSLANIDTWYQINVCYTSASNLTNCSSCLSQSSGPCAPMPGKPHWSVSSIVTFTDIGCTQRSVTVIISGVQVDDSGMINYYWVATAPTLYQSYSVSVDTNTLFWVEVVGGAVVGTFLLIVMGAVVLLCARRKGRMPAASEGQIQSEREPLIHACVTTGTSQPLCVAAGTLQHPKVGSPQHQIEGPPQHQIEGPPQHQIEGPPQHQIAGPPQHPLPEDYSPWPIIRTYSSASQPSPVNLVQEDNECVNDV